MLKKIFKYGGIIIVGAIVFFFIATSLSRLITFIVLAVLSFIIIKIRSSSYRLLLIFIAIFILFHLLIFPYTYLLIYNSDSDSIVFDESISKNVSQTALNESREHYKPLQTETKIKLVDDILNSSDSKLQTSVEYLNQNNIVDLGKYLIFKTWRIRTTNSGPIPDISLCICDSNGVFIDLLVFYVNDRFVGEDQTLKSLLNEKNTELKYYISKYQAEVIEINENYYWNYARLIPYSINIFSDNMIPKSGLANIIFTIHQIFLILIIGLILPGLYSFINNKFFNNNITT